MSDYIVVVEVENNRLKKHQPCKTLEGAEAFVARMSKQYPKAFVHPRVSENTRDLWVDVDQKTVISNPDLEELDKRVRQSIRSEGMSRLSASMQDSEFEISASIYLLYIRTGRQWNAGEQAVVDEIQPRFTYVKDLYLAVKQAIANIPNLTIEQKENFNAATDVAWPLPPA